MNKKIKEAFEQIRADEKLKDSTRAFLAQKTKGYTKGAAKRHPYLYAAVCACLLFLLIGGHLLYFTPTSVISIDINPSLELNVNRFDRIISVNGLNDDGQELAASIDLKYRDYRSALEKLLEEKSIADLLSGDEILTITVTGPDETQSVRIFTEIETYTSGHKNTYCYHSSSAEMTDAHASGLSCGKYRAFLELQALDPDITPEAVQKMTMREIMDLIDRLSGDGRSETLPGHDEGGGHHGSGSHGGSSEHRQRHDTGR